MCIHWQPTYFSHASPCAVRVQASAFTWIPQHAKGGQASAFTLIPQHARGGQASAFTLIPQHARGDKPPPSHVFIASHAILKYKYARGDGGRAHGGGSCCCCCCTAAPAPVAAAAATAAAAAATADAAAAAAPQSSQQGLHVKVQAGNMSSEVMGLRRTTPDPGEISMSRGLFGTGGPKGSGSRDSLNTGRRLQLQQPISR